MRGRAAAVACALLVAVAGCGGEDGPAGPETPLSSDFPTGPVTIDSPELRGLYGDLRRKEAAEPDDGRRVVLAAGCLACHQIGSEGNSGPGNNLSGSGSAGRPPRSAVRS